MTEWIGICKWETFQHYNKDRPRWIKLYRDLLSDYEFMELTPTQQALLVKLWLVYAKTAGKVPLDTAYLSRMTGQRVTKQQLERLNHAGFIVFNSRPETEGEKEVEQDKLASPPALILNMLNGRAA